jgi:flagellar basal body-associated protein FliL
MRKASNNNEHKETVKKELKKTINDSKNNEESISYG